MALNSFMCVACIFAMYPSTLKMTKPATKLVIQLIVLSRNRGDKTHEDMARSHLVRMASL